VPGEHDEPRLLRGVPVVGPRPAAGRELDEAAAEVPAADGRAEVGVGGGDALGAVVDPGELGAIEVEGLHRPPLPGPPR